MSSIMIAEYLDGKEAPALGERLKSEGMDPIVKRHGLPRMFGIDVNYRIFVDRTHAATARIIAEQFLAECSRKRTELKQLLTTQCPRCHSSLVAGREKKTFWLKFRFFGVSVWQCKECGSEWYT